MGGGRDELERFRTGAIFSMLQNTLEGSEIIFLNIFKVEREKRLFSARMWMFFGVSRELRAGIHWSP